MPKPNDPMAIHWDVMDSVTERLADVQERLEERLVTRPAVGEELDRDEARWNWLRMLGTPALMESFILQKANEYDLPPEYPIPREAVDYFLYAAKRWGLSESERHALEREQAPPSNLPDFTKAS